MDAGEQERLIRLGEKEEEVRAAGFLSIAGLDEAGRGPLAGPVVAAAVILPPGLLLQGLNDSKKVSPAKRSRLESEIKEKAVAWGLGEASHEEIDTVNILNATKLAMTRALDSLPVTPDYLLLDAIRLPVALPQESIVKGDATVACISAASILAKTYRDGVMEKWDIQYPEYGFRQHKGYPTAAHRKAVMALGPCPIHRRSFLGFMTAPKSAPDPRMVLGVQGEDIAAAWLESKGMCILERNFRCRVGEIDLIGQMGDMLAFVEVRGRSSETWGTPAESVDTRKRQKLRRVAEWYLCQRGKTDKPCRFDVVSLQYDQEGDTAQVKWFPNAF